MRHALWFAVLTSFVTPGLARANPCAALLKRLDAGVRVESWIARCDAVKRPRLSPPRNSTDWTWPSVRSADLCLAEVSYAKLGGILGRKTGYAVHGEIRTGDARPQIEELFLMAPLGASVRAPDGGWTRAEIDANGILSIGESGDRTRWRSVRYSPKRAELLLSGTIDGEIYFLDPEQSGRVYDRLALVGCKKLGRGKW